MTQALTRYNALYESLRSRRRKAEIPRGLDAYATRLVIARRRASPRSLRVQAEAIDRLAPELRGASTESLADRLRVAREAFVRGRADDAVVREAIACVREVARRETGEEAYPVQVIAALALFHGHVVEMLTGEGKTLTGSLAAPLLAWRHRHLHVFTVNDYLARRDAQSREAIYRRCGCSVGAIQQETDTRARAEVYSRSIVYGTPKQITADWLRDQIRLGEVRSAWTGRQRTVFDGQPGPLIPGLRAALVDEADAVLIDEGVVPLIIARSRREDDMAGVYREAASIAGVLDEGPDYTIEHVHRRAELATRGRRRIQSLAASNADPVWRAARRAEELVRQALVARHCYRRGHQYQVVDGRVVIVDEYTGRFLADRSWEHGLHQAVEAKEGLEVTADRETLARLSFQRFFRSYPVLSGMTGTVADAAGEIEHVYSRPILVVPTHRPVIREAHRMRVFRSQDAKWTAIAASIAAMHAARRPVLVGTRSIEASEHLGERLVALGLPHRVLNANFDKEEADLIAQAGFAGAITVATNMAGRGTDIRPDREAIEAGGLHVILTEMHTAKRIDRQFIGRAGRQGDPGSAQVFVSLDDELVRLEAPRLSAVLRARTFGDEVTPGPATRRLFRVAQRRAEARARRGRKQVLRQDDWIDKYMPGS